MVRFAVNAEKALTAEEQAVYLKMWSDGFADISLDRLSAAFIACLRSHTFKTMPTIGDIRQHLQKAEGNATEEGAALKWDRVREMIRFHYNPDIPWRGPKISERTRRAIAAAGGMAYLSECIGDNLVFARKRFIESYVRWDELKQAEYLLPAGKWNQLIAEAEALKALPMQRSQERVAMADEPEDRVTPDFDEARQRLGLEPCEAAKPEPVRGIRVRAHERPPECFDGTAEGKLFREWGRAFDARETTLTWREYKAQHFVTASAGELSVSQ